jgi:hypothetical protein
MPWQSKRNNDKHFKKWINFFKINFLAMAKHINYILTNEIATKVDSLQYTSSLWWKGTCTCNVVYQESYNYFIFKVVMVFVKAP